MSEPGNTRLPTSARPAEHFVLASLRRSESAYREIALLPTLLVTERELGQVETRCRCSGAAA